jgi:hypothetical protein
MRKINFFPKVILLSFLVLPASNNYQLEGFTMGNAGGGAMSSTNYEMNANVGEINNGNMSGNSYSVNAGLVYTLQANTPGITLDNPNNYYNKLQFVIDTRNNPSDTKYAIAISSDNFVTTQYIKSDNTIGTSLSISDYQTYAVWGGSTGGYVIGLNPGTTYQVKVKAMQGKFTESGYGPIASAATVNPTLSFDIDISAGDNQTDPPYAISLGDLLPGSVVGVGVSKVWVTLDTNAVFGANVFVYSQNGGLLSSNNGSKILSISGNLDVATTGFGLQNSSVGQSSGSLLVVSPYNGTANNIGILDTSYRNILSTTAPLISGRASFYVKAKAASDTPSGNDYTDSLTMVAAANF